MEQAEGTIAWRENALRRSLRRRTYLAFLVSAGLLLTVITFDALPFDLDLPGIPDVELIFPLYASLTLAWVVALAFLYATWLLYANAPVRIGFHREGIVVGYDPDRPAMALHLFTRASPREVAWKEVRSIVPAGRSGLSRHDVALCRRGARPWILAGLSHELRDAVVLAHRAHRDVAQNGSWQGYAPRPLS
ncbi:MAG: hypothetical protein KGJ23_09735 [Euryarchaeota archaeon]|nr:hypothetical protein [Euryarchaeota archaeon]MDE1836883.1 hypothetical protein [Euryarchaeota archaeon]MDE1881355.1 hypothetical protein [Euryarchaeota archaeon]MDE2045286.1 hypothetical protein [Thermoplasmata archaeon]